MLPEELTKAVQAADLLVADLRSACDAAGKENPLAGLYIHILHQDAVELRRKLQLAQSVADGDE
jgi:hypothetical protein